ncbi:MAG: hypothetical protein Q4A64_02430 [Porphyromonadaceae bacterium]|nr:hypothetical protein [Porphyromonadaceae bacterium]
MLWQIASATGWSLHHILWRVNSQTLVMMLQDAPRYLSKQEREEKKKRPQGKRGGLMGFLAQCTTIKK